MPLGQHVVHDYRTLSLSLKGHPVSFLRDRLDAEGVTPSSQLDDMADGMRVTVAGLVLVRQRPGNGNAIFMTLEDERSIANIIVWPKTFERFRPVVLGARFVRVRGRLQSASGVIHIVAETIEDLTPWLGVLAEEAQTIGFARAGAVAGPVEESRGRSGRPPHPRRTEPPRDGLPRAVSPLALETSKVMPKGRNFH